MTSGAAPSPGARRVPTVLVGAAWILTAVLAAREVAGWLAYARADAPDWPLTARRLLPLEPTVAARDPSAGPAAALELRPRDPFLLQDVADGLWRLDEAEARRLAVLAARFGPYDGRLAATNAQRLLSLATERARATFDLRERLRRLEAAPTPAVGTDEVRAEAAHRDREARETVAAILAIDAAIARDARGRHDLDAAVAEARHLLDDLGAPP